MNIAEYTIRNKVLSVIIIMLTIFGGWSAYNNMPRFEDPEFIIRTAVVFTQYAGASPEEVAREVTEPLETALQQLQDTLLKGCYSYLGMYPALSFVEAGCRRGPNLMEDGWYFDDFPRKKLNFYRCKVSTCIRDR